MASIPRIAGLGALCSVLLFCAGSATLKHRDRASTTSVQRRQPSALNGAIVLIDDWEQVPSGSDSAVPSNSLSSDISMGQSATVSDHPHRGPAGAPVTIVEYSDFQCPYCRKAESTLQQIRTDYGPKVRIVYMDFPLNFHADAMDAALAARCAGEQGRFWAYHDALISGSAGLSIPALKELAVSLSLHASTFDRCLDSRKYAGAIESDIAEGRQSGVSATPTFIIAGRSVSGTPTLPEFEKMVDAGLSARER